MGEKRYCISCMKEIASSLDDVLLCSDCGGPAEEPASLPTFLDTPPLEPIGAGTLLDTPPSTPELSVQVSIPDLDQPIQVSDGSVGGSALDSNPQGEEEAWPPGTQLLDTYEVKGLLGVGGMGKVYRVHHKSWNIDLALKSPRPEFFQTQAHKDLFISEAETWINLGLHPHIVSCYYVRTIEDIPRLFAECVEGGSLAGWIARWRIQSLEQALDIATQYAWGLAYAHEQGLVHRDVKPANVLMLPEGVAKVTDFGLAKAKKGLTAAYCSPEQADAQFDEQIQLSPASDLWSWALSLLEMIAGSTFWADPANPRFAWGVMAPQALQRYLEGKVENPRMSEIPPALGELLGQCFQREPEKRPGGMGEVAERLQEIYQAETGLPYQRQAPKAVELRADSLNNKALSLLDLGQPEKAIATWNQALSIDPQHIESTYNQGLVLWRTAQITPETLSEKMRAISSAHSRDWQRAYLHGLIHLEGGDVAAAKNLLLTIQGPGSQREEVLAALALANSPETPTRRLVRTFEGHRREVHSVCLSADGRIALSGARGVTVKLWEVESGKCLHSFAVHNSDVFSVCLSADGRYVLAGGWDGTLKLWEVKTEWCLRTFKGHTSLIESVCLSADGRYALSGSHDQTVKLWEVESGNCLRTFDGHKDVVNSVCLSLDGCYVLSGSSDKSLKVWETTNGQCLRTFEGHTHWVTSVWLSLDGRYALSGSHDHTLKLWDVETGSCLRTFVGHTDSVSSVCLSHDGRYALSGGADHTLRLWNVANGQCLHTFWGHNGWVDSVCLSTDGRYALSGSSDHSLKLWEAGLDKKYPPAPYQLSKAQSIQELLSSQSIYDQALLQAKQAIELGQVVEAAGHIRRARAQPGFQHAAEALELWRTLYLFLPRKSLISGWEAATFEGHTSKVTSVYLSADGRYALSGSEDTTLKLWDVERGNCLRTFEGHTHAISSVCLSADGRFALSGSRDNTLKLWDIERGNCLRTFERHTHAIKSVCLSADGRFALSGSRDNTLKLWDVECGYCLRTFDGHTSEVNSVCMSADGRYALSGGGECALKLWEIENGRCLRTIQVGDEEDGVESVNLSVDGRFAFSGAGDTLKLWELASERCLRTFKRSEFTSVCLSADGRYILSNDRIRLREMDTGTCLRSFEGHTDKVNSVCLSADGRYALSGSSDKTLKLWALDWEFEYKKPADWDEGALPYLMNFLILHTPFAGTLPKDRIPTEDEITLALTRRGMPAWTKNDFKSLLYTLGCAGFGWLNPEGVRNELKKMAKEMGKASHVTDEQALNRARQAFKQGQPLESVEYLRHLRSQPETEHADEVLEMWRRLYVCLPHKSWNHGWHAADFIGHQDTVNSVCLSVDGRYALSGSDDQTLKLWEVPSGRCLRTFDGHQGKVFSVSVSADWSCALSGSADKTLKLWEVQSGRCLRTFVGHTNDVKSVCLSADGRYVLSGSLDETIKLWEVENGRCLRTIEEQMKYVHSLCLSANGCQVLSGSRGWLIKLWDLASEKDLHLIFDSDNDGYILRGVNSACLSLDGRYVLSGGKDSTLRLWEITSRRCLHSFNSHTGEVTAVCLSCDGHYALSGSKDKTLKLWDVSDGRCLHTFEGHTGGVNSVCLSPDGSYALSGGEDHMLKLWSLDWALENKEIVDWDEGARPHLKNFLTLHTPYAGKLPQERTPTKSEITRALTRYGTPTYYKIGDFESLLYTLGCTGYGWLRPDGVRRELNKMAKEQGPRK